MWTTTIEPVQSVCGWAFSSDGRPWVAHRVWPIPSGPSSGRSRSTASRLRNRPALRRTWSTPSATMATPAESYPRYSSRLRPSRMMPVAPADPMYPTIPHMASSPHLRICRPWRKTKDAATRVPVQHRRALAARGPPARAGRSVAPAPVAVRATSDRDRRFQLWSGGRRARSGVARQPASPGRAPPRPALLDQLRRPLQRQGARRHVPGDHGSRADVGVVPDVSGATRLAFVPTNARAPIRVRCFRTPS